MGPPAGPVFGAAAKLAFGERFRSRPPLFLRALLARPGVEALRSRQRRGASSGCRAQENLCPIDDFRATALHRLGPDHKKLTYYHNGSQRRLTDVHGEVIRAVLG
jgi:hypothetical protein